MLKIQSGNCENCGKPFERFDTVQSTEVICRSCGKMKKLCQRCKTDGCKCGGDYLDAWERVPGVMF